jgi:hypothetical protein
MASMQQLVTATLLSIAALTLIMCPSATDAVQCPPCYNLQTGEYQGPQCPDLPSDDHDVCEPTYRLCGCCPECAGTVGDECHRLSVPCSSHLVCVNSQGVEKHHIEWDDQFIGKCQPPTF